MNLRATALATASGLLLAFAFPTFDLNILAWLAFIPLFIALTNQSVKSGFRIGGIFGLVYFTGTVYWVENSVHFYGGVPLIPASLITLLLCAYLALYPALFGAAMVQVRKNHPSIAFIIAPALWTVLELARTFIFSGFPWSLLGYTQCSTLPVIQMADITGVYGVSFLIVFVNAAGAEFLLNRKRFFPLLAAAITMALVLGYGFMRLHESEATGTITVSVVQGNIEQDKKWDPAYQSHVVEVYKRLTREAMKQHPDLILWPETAVPYYFTGSGIDRAKTDDLIQFVKENRISLLFGSPTYEIIKPGKVQLRNSAFLLAPGGTIAAEYHKIHLVPFGEYVPLKSVLFFVEKMVQAVGDFQPGHEYTVMAVPVKGNDTARVSTVICYEIIFPALVRQFVNRGANVVTTITNDAWFGRTAAPYQHFSMAVLRAVENRVPVARAANTGISGFIDTKGRILQTSPLFAEAHLTQSLALGNTKTFYTRYGDLFSYLCLIASLIILFIVPNNKLPGNKH